MRLSLFFSLFFVNIFFFSCSNSTSNKTSSTTKSFSNTILTKKDRQWMEKFFRDFFLEDPNQAAIYTLFGTKPMSFREILYWEEEDWKVTAEYFSKGKTPEKEKKIYEQMEKFYKEYDLHKNWDKWAAFIKKYPQSPFFFSKRESLFPSPKTGKDTSALVYIINIQEVIWTLQHHYDLFKKELGRDFSPIEETLDFENLESSFWNDVLSSTLLQGILYGFGEKNSYFFASAEKWKEQGNDFHDTRIFFSRTIPNHENTPPSVKNLKLPPFRSYLLPFNEDPVRLKYIEERKNIQKHLNDQNFFEKTFNQLIGNPEDNF